MLEVELHSVGDDPGRILGTVTLPAVPRPGDDILTADPADPLTPLHFIVADGPAAYTDGSPNIAVSAVLLGDT